MDKQARAYLLRHHQFHHYKKRLVQTFFVATQPLWDKWECVSNLSGAFSLTSRKLKSLISILCCFSSYLNLSLRLTARVTTGDEFSYGSLGRALELGHLEVTRETGSVLCRIATWDCWEFAPVLFAICTSPIMHLGIVLGIVLALYEEG